MKERSRSQKNKKIQKLLRRLQIPNTRNQIMRRKSVAIVKTMVVPNKNA